MEIPINLEDFFTFLRFKSVSTDPQYKEEMLACCDWVCEYLRKIGFKVEKWDTPGYPVIFASHMKAGPKQPTLLFYNHYDVQPVDPLELWTSDPFQPEVREGEVYARGAQDNKGQCFYVLEALKEVIHKEGKLPINIKLCIEGEEECGSAGLSHVLNEKQKELAADYLAVVDVGINSLTSPSITLGIRGIMALEVEVKGSRSDLHSGSHGGLAYNPLHALSQLLASLRDSDGKILVPGFYDNVAPPNQKELQQFDLSFNPKEYEKMFGIAPTGGEKHYSPLESNWIRPTLEINGISGGYTGEGFKTVIPAKANAKISCRLVPGQDPNKIAQSVATFLESQSPKGVKTKVTIHQGGGPAVRANIASKVVQAFSKAYTDTFKLPCHYILEGASIPIVTTLAKASGSEVALVGLGLPDDNIHAPNEHFGIDRLKKGASIIAKAIQCLKK